MAESRPYRSERRRQQADETRREILRAARRLFAERGYAATPLTDIAAEAGVSVPTLYASIGAKPKIALALIDFINEEAEIDSLAGVQDAATTGREAVAASAHLVRVLHERCGDIMRALISAAANEPEVAAAVEVGRRYAREGSYATGRRLARLGALRAGLDAGEAGAIVTTLSLPEVIEQLATVEGWSYDRIEAWLTDTFERLLLAREGWASPPG